MKNSRPSPDRPAVQSTPKAGQEERQTGKTTERSGSASQRAEAPAKRGESLNAEKKSDRSPQQENL